MSVYELCGQTAPQGARGLLTVWHAATPERVSVRRRRPAVLILPGGGYHRTSSREAQPVALRFLAQGYVPFVLEYSCAPFAFPTALREAVMAMAYIRSSADRWEVDAAQVAAMGFSAGGHLAGTLGTMFDCPEVADLAPASVARPDALALCYPVAVSWGSTHDESFVNISGGDAALRARLSLEKQARPDMPPTFLWHTRDDQSVPCRNSILLAAAMDEAGVDFAFHLYRHGQHGLSTADTMVYAVQRMPQISWDVPGWMESLLHFWADAGLHMIDEEDTV